MSGLLDRLDQERHDLRAEIAREVVQQAAQLIDHPEKGLIVTAGELEQIVRRVLTQFGIR